MFEIAQLKIGPRDVLVLKTEQILSKGTLTALRKSATKALRKAGLKNKILILSQGASISVVRRAA